MFPHESALGSEFEVYLGAHSELFLEVTCGLTLEHTVKQAGIVPSTAIGSALENVLGSGVESALGVYFGVFIHAGWGCIMKCNWKST